MKTNSSITQTDLDNLLESLSPDREEAGKKYNEIREGLVRYFRAKGCYDSQCLADETMSRVARKVAAFDTSGGLKPITYFFGFAKNIFLEYLADLKRTPMQLEPSLIGDRAESASLEQESKELRFKCLDACLSNLHTSESTMMLDYFSKDRSEKFEARRSLASRLNVSMGNLHVKVYRVKNVLRECVESCLQRS